MNVETVWRWAEGLGAWAWRASWQGALLAVVVAIVLWAVGKKMSPGWRFALWGLVLVRLAMPALVTLQSRGKEIAEADRKVVVRSPKEMVIPAPSHLPRPDLSHPRFEALASEPAAAKLHSAPEPAKPAAQAAHEPERISNAWNQAKPYAIGAWLLGAALLGLRVAWLSLRLGRAVGRMPVIQDARLARLMRACCDELDIASAPQMREMPGMGAPALVGCWRPKVLLPAHVLAHMEDEELRLILMHELAHVKRQDVLLNWLATLVAVMHWPNPAVWCVLWRMRLERELACDEKVLRAGMGAAYGRTIVRLVETLSAAATHPAARIAPLSAMLPGGAVSILEGKAQIQRRLLMIAQFNSKSHPHPTLPAALVLLVGALALSGVTRAADTDAKPESGVAQLKLERPAGNSHKTTKPIETTTPPSAPEEVGSGFGAPGQVDLHRPMPGAAGGRGATSVAAMAAPPPPSAAPMSPEEEKANARTAEKLKKAMSQVNFNGQALSDVVDFLRDAAGVDILVEWPALEQIGVARDATVTLQLREPTPLDAVLPLMFRAMNVDVQYEIDKGVVVIGPSTRRAAAVVRVYDVSDLLTKVTSAPGTPVVSPGGFGGAGMGGFSDPNEAAQLMQLITATVEPTSWREAGGESGTITWFKNKLVIKTSEATHKEIASLLEMLRDKPAEKGKAVQR